MNLWRLTNRLAAFGEAFIADTVTGTRAGTGGYRRNASAATASASSGATASSGQGPSQGSSEGRRRRLGGINESIASSAGGAGGAGGARRSLLNKASLGAIMAKRLTRSHRGDHTSGGGGGEGGGGGRRVPWLLYAALTEPHVPHTPAELRWPQRDGARGGAKGQIYEQLSAASDKVQGGCAPSPLPWTVYGQSPGNRTRDCERALWLTELCALPAFCWLGVPSRAHGADGGRLRRGHAAGRRRCQPPLRRRRKHRRNHNLQPWRRRR